MKFNVRPNYVGLDKQKWQTLVCDEVDLSRLCAQLINKGDLSFEIVDGEEKWSKEEEFKILQENLKEETVKSNHRLQEWMRAQNEIEVLKKELAALKMQTNPIDVLAEALGEEKK